jgi:signal transduction histidine kinase
MRWRRLPESRLARGASGVLAGVALVAAATAVVALLEPHIPVASLLVLYLLAVLPVAIVWGARLAALTSVLSVVIFAVLFLPPQGALRIAEPSNLAELGVFLVTAVVVAELAARSRRAAVEARRLTEEQSALRRVATLVARAEAPSTVFEAVTREVGLLSGADLARMERYEPDGSVTGVAAWSRVPARLSVGTRFPLDGLSVARDVQGSGGPVRLGSFAGATGVIAAEARALGIRSSVGCPITVAGRLWGVIAASTKNEQPFPVDTEAQIASFTELVATAVENAEARAELRRMAEEQAALRRVATLVARGGAPELVFAAVADEVGTLFHADATALVRFEPNGEATFLAGTGWATTQPEGLADEGFPSKVDAPISVEGRLWGAITIASGSGPLGPDVERRIVDFGELIATAIANAEAHTKLTQSRARIVATADATRRRIERDLHDGAQQRLVSLALDLRAAQESVPAEQDKLRTAVGQVAEELTAVLDDLREMSRGIHPAILSEGGLGPALRTLARRAALPVELTVGTDARYPPSVEVAAYYVVSEALANTVKHAEASHAEVVVDEREGRLHLRIADDGAGGARPERGTGLTGLRDRVEALGGSIDVASPAGHGTVIRVDLPTQPG